MAVKTIPVLPSLRTIIAGSRRSITYPEVVRVVDACGWLPSVVLSGTALGVDTYGERLAEDRNWPIERYPADWKTHGNSAGAIRNAQMAQNAEALIAIWDGRSPGTENMIKTARKLGLRIYVDTKLIDDEEEKQYDARRPYREADRPIQPRGRR